MRPDYVTRFAPSPTGPLHLGHAYSAILAHDMARAAGGQFLLRMEDTDLERSRPEFDDQIIAIAKVEGAEVIYSSDIGLAKEAPPQIEVISLSALPLPPQDPQMTMKLEGSSTAKTDQDDAATGALE